MPRQNKLVESPPYPVEGSIKQLGENLRNSRLRRNMTIAEAAERIGTGPRAVMDAEKGKPSTGIVVYVALLWLYNQLDEFKMVGDSMTDREGIALESASKRVRASRSKGLDDDF